MPRRPPKNDPYLQQAELETALQINPQLQALAALLAGKRSDYINTRRVNASNARGIAEAANLASLRVGEAYGGSPQAPRAGGLLAALKGSADTPEGEAAFNRLAGEQAHAQSMFADQASRAQQGRVYGNQQARDEWLDTKDKVNASFGDLQTTAGQLTAATLGKLLEGRRERQAAANNRAAENKQSEANSWRSAGYTGDPAKGGKPIPGGPADVNDPRDKPKGKGGPKGKTGLKLATAEQHGARS
jgi:hypothetical protein